MDTRRLLCVEHVLSYATERYRATVSETMSRVGASDQNIRQLRRRVSRDMLKTSCNITISLYSALIFSRSHSRIDFNFTHFTN